MNPFYWLGHYTWVGIAKLWEYFMKGVRAVLNVSFDTFVLVIFGSIMAILVGVLLYLGYITVFSSPNNLMSNQPAPLGAPASIEAIDALYKGACKGYDISGALDLYAKDGKAITNMNIEAMAQECTRLSLREEQMQFIKNQGR